jgi:hypothetical protein
MSWNLPESKIFLSPIGNNLAPSSISHVLNGRTYVHCLDQAGSKIHPTSYPTGARGFFHSGKAAEA